MVLREDGRAVQGGAQALLPPQAPLATSLARTRRGEFGIDVRLRFQVVLDKVLAAKATKTF